MLLTARELSLVHNVDERIPVENVERCLGFYKSFIRNAGGKESSRE
jgi:acetylornithine deacetylase/succinyl-diaminopimelate desuccinylase-like protein